MELAYETELGPTVATGRQRITPIIKLYELFTIYFYPNLGLYPESVL
jgi:hypothetical protein